MGTQEMANNSGVTGQEVVAESLRMRSEALRLDTFRSWRHNDKVEAGKIAKAGFFHTGNDSEVKCLWCGTVLNEWEYGDSVMARHRSADPQCPFIRNISDNVPLLAANNENHSQTPSDEDQSQTAESQDDIDTPMEDQEEERTDTSRRQPEVQQPLPTAAGPEPVNLELYKSEASRLETFSGWPHRVIRPADLANAGFIYTGERDMVRCVFCGQYVGNWEDDDFPMVEHRTLFPNCPFMQGFNVGNVPLPSYHQQQSTPSRVDHQASTSSGFSGAAMEIPEPTNIDETGIRPHHRQAFSGPEKGPNVRYVNGGPPPNDESIGIIRHSGPANTKFSTLEARLRTFKDWPPALKQEPRQLADAGFYYIGLSDQTKCFYCEGGLRNWQPDDDPWTEHARWFSKCGYVRLIKGDDFILNCVDKKPPSHQGGKDKPISGGSPDLKALMTMPIVQEVLAMGISQPRIELALKQKAVDRKMFSTANELATAALSVQLEEQARIIPNSTESQASSEPAQPPRSTSAPGATTAPAPPAASTSLSGGASAETLNTSAELVQENQRLKEQRTCKICMDNEISVVFLPCAHLICCVQCAPSLRDCPLCRQSIHGTVKTYMS